MHCALQTSLFFFKSYIISQKGRWGVHSPWTMPKSTHRPVLIKGRVSGFKLQVTFYKLLDAHCNFPCTCMLKKHFGGEFDTTHTYTLTQGHISHTSSTGILQTSLENISKSKGNEIYLCQERSKKHHSPKTVDTWYYIQSTYRVS